MRTPLVLTLAALVIALALWARSADAAGSDPRLSALQDWAFAIGADVDSDERVRRLAPFDLVVLDAESTPRARVAQLRASGALVLGYLSVGTIERFRPWYRAAKPFRMELWGDWGEWYANVRAPGYRRLLLRRLAPKLLRKGFDGLFLDNVDMVDGHPKQRRAMFRLVRGLSRLVHRRGGYLFAQNGAKAIKPVWGALDGWNREEVSWSWDFRRRRYVAQAPGKVRNAVAELRRLAGVGLMVTSTDYTRAADAVAVADSVGTACAAGALPYVSDVWLRRIPAAALACAP